MGTAEIFKVSMLYTQFKLQ